MKKYEYVNCNLCGKDMTKVMYQSLGVNIVRCLNCGLVYVNPRPIKKYLGEIYSSDYFNKRWWAGLKERKEMYKLEVKDLEKFRKSGKIVDIGCGGGFFLSTLGKEWEKYGTELSVTSADYAKKNFGIKVFVGDLTDLKIKKNFFDVVHIRGTIEHLPDPKANIEKMHGILKEEGLLVVSTTPNIDSICGRLFGSKFRLVKGAEHLYLFSPKTITKMLNKTGFKVIKIIYPYFGTPYDHPLKDFFQLFFNKLSGKESPAFFGSAMTIFAVKKKCNDS